jgi:PTH1 family peptidyl-tRNA hydrolase
MKLLVGLGNPGKQYAHQRHNVGYMAIDAIIAGHAFGTNKKRFHSETAEGTLDHIRVLAIKPQTFMNDSGRAVGEAARYLKIDTRDIIVIHDEIDLAAGKVKIKTGGGNAGHNGLKSITSHIGADFTRVRIGIGHPGDKRKVHAHVLGDFSKADGEWLQFLLHKISDHMGELIDGDTQQFLISLNGNANPSAKHSFDGAIAQARRNSATKSTNYHWEKLTSSQRDLAKNMAELGQEAKKKLQPKLQGDAPSRVSNQYKQYTKISTSPFDLLRRVFGRSHSSDHD